MPSFFFILSAPLVVVSELPASAGGPNLALGSMGTGLDLGRRKVIFSGGQKTPTVTPFTLAKMNIYLLIIDPNFQRDILVVDISNTMCG